MLCDIWLECENDNEEPFSEYTLLILFMIGILDVAHGLGDVQRGSLYIKVVIHIPQ